MQQETCTLSLHHVDICKTRTETGIHQGCQRRRAFSFRILTFYCLTSTIAASNQACIFETVQGNEAKKWASDETFVFLPRSSQGLVRVSDVRRDSQMTVLTFAAANLPNCHPDSAPYLWHAWCSLFFVRCTHHLSGKIWGFHGVLSRRNIFALHLLTIFCSRLFSDLHRLGQSLPGKILSQTVHHRSSGRHLWWGSAGRCHRGCQWVSFRVTQCNRQCAGRKKQAQQKNCFLGKLQLLEQKQFQTQPPPTAFSDCGCGCTRNPFWWSNRLSAFCILFTFPARLASLLQSACKWNWTCASVWQTISSGSGIPKVDPVYVLLEMLSVISALISLLWTGRSMPKRKYRPTSQTHGNADKLKKTFVEGDALSCIDLTFSCSM